MCLLIVWLVFSFNRLSRWPKMIRRLCGTASAFLLKSFLQTGVMVRLGSHFLSGIELCPVAERGNGGKIALAYIDAYNAGMALWHGIWCLNGQRDQQIEALSAPIIPEFGRADTGSRLQAALHACA